MKNILYILIPILLLNTKSYSEYKLENRVKELEQEKKNLEKVLKVCDSVYIINLKNLKGLETELEIFRRHEKRMQKIAGVKNVDSVFTWKEKVLNPINTKQLLKK